MKRREFFALAGATMLLPKTALAQNVPEMLVYDEGLVAEHLAKGETVFVDFYADWCGTCRAQDRVINKLRAANPSYDKAMTFIKLDWDLFGDGDLSKSLNIPRRSTLVVLKGDKEIGRVVAGTSKAQIKELLDAGMAAAAS